MLSCSHYLVTTLSLSLCSTEALTRVPSGANSRVPCASRLCGPVPEYEFREERGVEGEGWVLD